MLHNEWSIAKGAMNDGDRYNEYSQYGQSGRANRADIDVAWEAVKVAQRSAIQPFISVSPLHRQVKLGKTRDEVLEMARAAVALGRSFTENVDFALEDTTR